MTHPKMNFLREGSGDEAPVVLVHGYTGDSQSWRLVAPMVSANRTAVSIDLPCHGESPLVEPDGFEDFVETIAQAIEGEGLEGFHLVGHSLGGAVAFALSERMAGQIKSVCAVAPAGLAPEVDGGFVRDYPKATAPEDIAFWLNHIVGEAFELPDGLTELIAEKRNDPARIAAQVAIGRLFFAEGVQAIDVTPQMNKISVPCKIIWGKQDTLIPWHHCLKAPPQVALHLMEKVGHMPPVEAPQVLADLINELIATAS